MIKGTFPRQFGNHREGAFLATKFVTSGTGTAVTFANTTTQGNVSYPLTLARTGVGLYTLTLPGGARNIHLVTGGCNVASSTAARSGTRLVPAAADCIAESTGVILLRSMSVAGVPTTDIVDAGDEIHTLLYVDK